MILLDILNFKSTNLNKLFICLFLSFCPFSSFCFAQQRLDPEIRTRCNEIGTEVGAAYVANDWDALKRLSSWQIESCKNVMPREDYYGNFANLAVAERELGNYAKALKVAQECITNRYGLAVCHIEEYFVLKILGKKAQANSSGKKFYNIVVSEITKTKKMLSNNMHSRLELDLAKSKLDLYESMLSAYLGSLSSDAEKDK